MKVLISAKETYLDLYGQKMDERVTNGAVTNSYFTLLNRAHTQHYETLNVLRLGLEKNKIQYQELSKEQSWSDLKTFDYLITVGGDGTLLAASHQVLDDTLPVVGICSSEASVGYLCAYRSHQVEELIRAFVQKNSLTFQQVSRLQALIHQASTQKVVKTEASLNDVLFANASPAVTTRYRCVLNDISENHRSSGIWISTACGSTAVSQTAGGQQVSRDSDTYQFVVRELYTPKGQQLPKISKGFMNLEQDSFEIYNQCEEAIIAIDGQHRLYNLEYGDKISFSKAESISLAQPS